MKWQYLGKTKLTKVDGKKATARMEMPSHHPKKKAKRNKMKAKKKSNRFG